MGDEKPKGSEGVEVGEWGMRNVRGVGGVTTRIDTDISMHSQAHTSDHFFEITRIAHTGAHTFFANAHAEFKR